MTTDGRPTPTGGPAVSVLVPWRDAGCPHRRRAWAWVAARWAELAPAWQLVTAEPDPGPWNYAQAANRCAAAADGDVYVLTGADILTDLIDVTRGIVAAERHGWAHPYAEVTRLDELATRRILARPPASPADLPAGGRRPSLGCGLIVVTAAAWHAVDGMDERFIGWGGEDNALGHALDRIVGPPARLNGRLGALWHPRDPNRIKGPRFARNRALYQRYRRTPDAAAMRVLLEEPRRR